MSETSPVIPQADPTSTEKKMDFFEALKHVAIGKKIHKLEWSDRQYYGFLDQSRLKLHKSDDSLHDWVISEGDLLGVDWVIV